jgi:hypothetical protein
MLREAPVAGPPALGNRAEVARLTLELRAAVRDAETAESAESVESDAAADLETAREKLRARLQPLVEDRRTAFEAELIQVRAETSDSVAAARRAAAATVTRDYSLVDRAALPEPTDPPLAPLFASLAVAPVTDSLPPVDEMLRWFDDPPTTHVSVTAPAEDVPALASPVSTSASHAQLATTNVGIDAEAFAQAFATAFAALLDERGAAWGMGVPGMSAISGPAGPPVAKSSFWTHARHPDVLLIGLAMIIMMIVVAAWLA